MTQLMFAITNEPVAALPESFKVSPIIPMNHAQVCYSRSQFRRGIDSDVSLPEQSIDLPAR